MTARGAAIRLGGLIVVVGVVAAGIVLGRRATQTELAQPGAAAPATIAVRSGVLEETRPLTVSAQWMEDRPLFNRLGGTITSSGLPDQSASIVTEGYVLLSVDRKPVIAVEGSEPAYRTIKLGVTGSDVEWIQRYLGRVGLLLGEVDGKWGISTASAWKTWQRVLGLEESGEVPLGQVVFISDLPRRVAPTDTLVVGNALVGGERMAALLDPLPAVFAEVSVELAATLPAGASVDIEFGAQTLSAQVSTRRTTSDRGIRVELDLESVACGEWCNEIESGPASAFAGIVHLSKPVSGVIVPIGALRAGTGDSTVVILADGGVKPVQVLAKVGAEAVVDGIPPDAILLLGDTVSTASSVPDASLSKTDG